MADPNGNEGSARLDRIEEMLITLIQAQRANLDEHERIWQAVDKLREAALETGRQVSQLTGSIRDLIDRIPPETCASYFPSQK